MLRVVAQAGAVEVGVQVDMDSAVVVVMAEGWVAEATGGGEG